METSYKTQEELYQKVRPALKVKVTELKRLRYEFIKEEDIWNYLKESKWRYGRGLVLSDLVNDILTVDGEMIQSYVLKELKHQKRELNLEEEKLWKN